MTVELAFEKKLVQLRLCNGQLFVCFTQFLILRRPMLGPKRPIFIQKRPKGPVTTQKRPILTQDRRKKSIFSPKDLCAHFRNSYLECAHSRACRLCWQKISQKSQFTALNDCRTYFWEIHSWYAPIQGPVVCADKNFSKVTVHCIKWLQTLFLRNLQFVCAHPRELRLC